MNSHRSPLSWYAIDEGYAAKWSLTGAWPGDREFVIESQVADENGKATVYFTVREGDAYIYRWTPDLLGDDIQQFHYGLRAAIFLAERFRYEQEVERHETRHPRRALLSRMFGLERLRREGFSLWLNTEYGKRDWQVEQWERLVEAEVLKRHRLEAAS